VCGSCGFDVTGTQPDRRPGRDDTPTLATGTGSLRLGAGPVPDGRDQADFVLEPLDGHELTAGARPVRGDRPSFPDLPDEFPGDPEVTNSLGVALFNCGEFARAVDTLSVAMQERGSREAAVNLVNVLLLLDKDREACDVAMSFALGLPDSERAGFMRELSRALGPELFSRVHGEASARFSGNGTGAGAA